MGKNRNSNRLLLKKDNSPWKGLNRFARHCYFYLHFKWNSFPLILAFFSSFYLSAAAFQVPTYHAMPRSLRCAWVVCARNLKTCGQRRTSSVYQIQNGGQNTLHAALTKYARSEALTRHCRFTVMFYGF